MTRLVYVVVQHGIYRHDIRGVYASHAQAETAAKRAAIEDRDSYHDYQVFDAVLGEYVEDLNETDGLRFSKDRPEGEKLCSKS